MVCHDTTELIFDKEKDEVIVISKLKFSNKKKEKVVAAVSVLFTQTRDDVDMSNSVVEKWNVPTSLSFISLPQLNNQLGNKLISNLVTEKFTENLNPVEHNLATSNNTCQGNNNSIHEGEQSNGSSFKSTCIKVENVTSNVSICSNTESSGGNSSTCIFNGSEMNSRDIVQQKYLNMACQTDCDDLKSEREEETIQKIMVDVSTSTENLANTDKNHSEDEVPLKRKRKSSSEFYVTEDADMFIITENKLSGDENSQSPESHVESTELMKCRKPGGESLLSEKRPNFLADDSMKTTSKSTETSDSSKLPVFIIDDSDSESIDIKNRNQTPEASEVSIVDLSSLPIFCSNFGSNTSSQQAEQDQTVIGDKQPSITRFFRSKLNKMAGEKCQICKKVLSSLADMFYHSKVHNLGIKCCICGMKAYDWGVMKHHYSWHLSKTPFKCPQCSANYSNREFLSAHMIKAHSGGRSLVNVKNPKLKPPASKLTVNLKSMPKTKLPPPSNANKLEITQDTNNSPFKLTKFSPFSISSTSTAVPSQSVQQPEHITVRPLSPKVTFLSPSKSRMISNYSCDCCNEKFTSIEMLKQHILIRHPEESMVGDQSKGSSVVNASFITDDNATCGSSSHFVTGENSNTASSVFSTEHSNQQEIKQEIPEVIDIEQLSQFTESFDNSRSTVISNTSNDHISSRNLTNCTPDSFEQSLMSSLDISPTCATSSRQRKTACRLSNIMPVCRICGIFLNNWNDILEHRFCHPEEIGDQLACTVCSSVLSTRDSLKRHAVNHMGIRHQCLYCENEYSRRDSLMTHMKSAHGHGSNIVITSNYS